jgi:hypothetical protein
MIIIIIIETAAANITALLLLLLLLLLLQIKIVYKMSLTICRAEKLLSGETLFCKVQNIYIKAIQFNSILNFIVLLQQLERPISEQHGNKYKRTIKNIKDAQE